MPNYENNNLHGTLYVTFDVEFPKQEFNAEEKEGKHDDRIKKSMSLNSSKFFFFSLQTYEEYLHSHQIIEFIMDSEGHSNVC